jgi:hypothetical protein
MTLRSTKSWRISVWLAVIAVVVSLAFVGRPPAARATDAFPTTNDQSVNIGTARWWYHGVTADQITTLINQNGARLTEIRVEDPAVPTFVVTMVRNSGAYASAWWWYFGVDATTLSGLLSQRRLISLEPYQTSAGLRFAAVMVPNTGSQARAWWWYFGVSQPTVGALLSQNNARLVSLRPYVSGGQRVFAVIMVSNTGTDFKSGTWFASASIADISNDVNTNKRRVVAFTVDPAGGFDAILVDSEGEGWWWWFGIDPATVTNNLVNHGTRLIDVSSYLDNGVRRYTAVELDDSNPDQAPINSESTRVKSWAESNGWGGGFHGAYFIRSSSGSSPTVATDSTFRFEPASTMKVLYLLYTLKQVQAGNITLDSSITYYFTNATFPPSAGACPSTSWETAANARTTTVRTALNEMIKNSNNVLTRAFAIRWGLGAVQGMANGLGMSGTHLNQGLIGCGFQGGVRNETTLTDLAKLYGAVDAGTALSGANRTTFFSTLVGGPRSATDQYGAIVVQEAARLGKSSVVSAFLARFDVRWKGGSYGFCLSSTCGPYKADLSVAGRMSIPFKNSNGSISNRTYLFGDFVNDLVIPCVAGSGCAAENNANNAIFASGAEASRSTIRSALTTW